MAEMSTAEIMKMLSPRKDEPVQGKVVSQEETDRQRLMEVLSQLGSGAVGDDDIKFEGTAIVLPASLAGPEGFKRARQLLREAEQQQEKKFEFAKTFPYRHYDGAAAFNRAMVKLFGTAGIGKSWYDMFGQEHHPKLISIEVAAGKSIQVPWNEIKFSILDAVFDVGAVRDPVKGILSCISVVAPHKYRTIIEGFFAVVEDELRERSIYRGKAINGADIPGFFKEHAVDPRSVVYNAGELEQLQANVWTITDHAEELRKHNIPLKRAFLLEGTFGVGKTLAGALTAQHATQHGWTFILVRPEDDPLVALRTAQLYSPAVVWVEDVDNVANKNASRAQIGKVLDAMDNVAGKNAEIMVGFTTNYPDLIEKGMLRPGRIDSVIHLGPLEREATEQLIKVTLPAHLLKDIDYEAVTEAFKGYVPAYAVEAAQRAVRYSIARNNGHPSVITTEDLVAAANGLRRQLEMMEAADEAADLDTVDGAVQRVVVKAAESVLKRTQFDGMAFEVKPVDTRNGSS